MTFSFFRFAFVILLFFISCLQACSGNAKCTGDIGPLKINPNNSQCTQKCECNNQRYTGDCIQGKCNSQERATCTAKGKITICVNHITKCQGRDICQDKGLTAKYLGDCKCEEEGKPQAPKGVMQDECRTDEDCESPLICVEGADGKFCAFECKKDDDCKNACKGRNEEFCTNEHEDALDNLVCEPQDENNKQDKICIFAKCKSKDDCPEGMVCNARPNHPNGGDCDYPE